MGFLNKVKKGIEQGANTIGSKSKEVLDSAKVKREIDGLEKQKEEILREIGLFVYEGYINDSLDETKVMEKCDMVTKINQELQQKEKDLESIKNKPKE